MITLGQFEGFEAVLDGKVGQAAGGFEDFDLGVRSGRGRGDRGEGSDEC